VIFTFGNWLLSPRSKSVGTCSQEICNLIERIEGLRKTNVNMFQE
jgi:hypothetical protein